MFGGSLLMVLLAGVVAVLVAGVVLMGIGGKANEKYGNKLMLARVTLQACVIGVLLLMFALSSK